MKDKFMKVIRWWDRFDG